MPRDSKIIGYRKKKTEIASLIDRCKLEKVKIKLYEQELHYKYLANEISVFEYESMLEKALNGKTIEYWNNYYDDLTAHYENELFKYDRLIEQEKTQKRANILGPAILIIGLLITLLLFFSNPQFTGFIIFEGNVTNESLINYTQVINITEQNITQLNITNKTVIDKEIIEASKGVVFDRILECQRCGQHKAPPTTNVNMSVSISNIATNGTLTDYYPVEWSIVDANGGISNVFNSTFNKIEWIIENQTDAIKSYVIRSPERTLPPTKYDFVTEYNNNISDPWFVIVSDPIIGTENVLWYFTNSSSGANGANALISSTVRTNFTMNQTTGPVASFRVVGGANAVYYPLENDVISFPNQSLWDMNITTGILINIYCNSTTNTATRRTRIDTANLTMFNILTNAVTSLGTTLGTPAGGSPVCPTGVLNGNTSTNITDTIADVVPYGFRLGTNFRVDVSSGVGTAGSIIAWGGSANPSNVSFTWVPVNGFTNVSSFNATTGDISQGLSFIYVTNLTCTLGRCGNTSIVVAFNTTAAPTTWTTITSATAINLTFAQNNPSYDCGNLSDTASSNENRTCAVIWNLTGKTDGVYGVIANISWTNSSDNTMYNSTISSGIASQVASTITVSAPDTTYPLYSDKQKNKTVVLINEFVNFTANLTDEASLDAFVFTIKFSSSSAYINSTPFKFGGSTKWANISNLTRIQTTANTLANVTWFFYFNDTAGNSNTTGLDSFLVDNINPNYTDAQKNVSIVYQTYLVNFTANLSDDSNLAGFIFSINLGSGFINSSLTSLSNKAHNASNITQINAAQGTNVSWFFYFNDTYSNSNTTGLNSFIVADNTTPTYIAGSVLKNQTTVLQNMYVNFSSNWTDNVRVDSFIFEINHTDIFRNSSSYTFGSATGNASSNITFITVAVGTNVSWRFWVNDSSNNWNVSGIDSFLVSEPSQVNRAPVILDINTIPLQSPTEDSSTNVSFSFLVDDQDGTSNLSVTSAFAVFNVSDYSTQRNTACGKQPDINTTTANFSCAILAWYFDPAGNWSVIANISDNQNTSVLIEQWNYSELTAIKIAPQSLTWATIAAGSKNQTSNNDPIVINNTGNGNLSQVRVQAINIHGLTTTAQFIPVANFTVYNNTAATNPECNENIASSLVNNSATNINGIGVYRGNHSAASAGVGAAGQQVLYYCIRDVPSAAIISSQTYSTNNTGSWTISVI